ncbi:MAG: serine protein kinase PrkA, partial [Planctomycetota bacterium]
EMNKYLLTTCERGTVNLGNCMAFLDLAIFGTANEKQLSMFKRSPDFSSFKGRMELISVPYLLRYSAEASLYRRHVRSYSKGRHVTPHSSKVAALWAVLTRLRRPDPENYEEPLRSAVADLRPLEKARLYDAGDVPDRLNEDQKKILRASILEIRQEYEEAEEEFEGIFGAEYEGRRGVSPREMMTVLAQAAETGMHKCLTPMAVFDTLEELLRDSSLYDFLRLPPNEGYRDMRALLDDVKGEYFRWVTDEVYRSIRLIDETEYDRVFLEYFRHVKAFDAGEQVKNPRTGTAAPPDEDIMTRIEEQVGITEPTAEWRSNIMLRIAAWALDHPGESIDYHALFPDILRAMRDQFYGERNRILTLIEQDILKYGTDEFELLSDSEKEQVLSALGRMKDEYGYCDSCARDVIAYVLTLRTQLEEVVS